MTRRNLSLVLMLAVLSALASIEAAGQSKAQKIGRKSVENLRLSFTPYTGAGLESMPVEVVVFDAIVNINSMWVRDWRLRNRSDKTVTKVRQTLFVYSEGEPDKLLLRHAIPPYYGVGTSGPFSPNVEWPKEPCPAGKRFCPWGFAMLSAQELFEPLMKDGKIEGNYRVALGIDKVWFADGTVWEFAGE